MPSIVVTYRINLNRLQGSFMKKYLLFILLLFGVHLHTDAQFTRRTIDSLLNLLPSLKDSDRVDCLNQINIAFARSSDPNVIPITRSDSVRYYATVALNEADKINYQKGRAMALVNLARAEFLKIFDAKFYPQFNDPRIVEEMEKYLSQAIPIAEKLQYYETLGDAYMLWGDMLNKKSNRKDFEGYANAYKESIKNYEKAGDIKNAAEAATWVSFDYIDKGYYEEGLDICKKSLQYSKKWNPLQTPENIEWKNYLIQQALSNMSQFYRAGGDYEETLKYLDELNNFGIANKTGWYANFDKSSLYVLLNQPDSALKYQKLYSIERPGYWGGNYLLGQIYLNQKEYGKALPILISTLDSVKVHHPQDLIRVYTELGSTYTGLKIFDQAQKYTQLGINTANEWEKRAYLINGYELMSGIQHELGRDDSAYFYLSKYITLKDSVQNRQFIFKLNNYKRVAEDEKKQTQIQLLDKDNKLKGAQIKQEVQQKNFLLILLSALGLTGFFVYRNISLKRKNEKIKHEQLESEMKMQQLENEKKQGAFLQQTAELEMQALRAQMNPHFIFNCLSSINRFILKNESKTASNYLTRFSRLMRMVLTNSQKPLIALDDELEMLRLYLEMERLRFKNSFDYSINFVNAIDSDNIFIPSMLLQPFCENAIWHGLMHKDEPGRLDIELSMKENILHCIITDNGVGREKAAEMKSKTVEKEKPMGLKITTERLALFNREKDVHTFYEIEDLKDENGDAAGTKIIIRISFKETVEETI